MEVITQEDWRQLLENADALLDAASKVLAPNGRRFEDMYFNDRGSWDNTLTVPKRDYPNKHIAATWLSCGKTLLKLKKEMEANSFMWSHARPCTPEHNRAVRQMEALVTLHEPIPSPPAAVQPDVTGSARARSRSRRRVQLPDSPADLVAGLLNDFAHPTASVPEDSTARMLALTDEIKAATSWTEV